jgi:hypothetical protein
MIDMRHGKFSGHGCLGHPILTAATTDAVQQFGKNIAEGILKRAPCELDFACHDCLISLCVTEPSCNLASSELKGTRPPGPL